MDLDARMIDALASAIETAAAAVPLPLTVRRGWSVSSGDSAAGFTLPAVGLDYSSSARVVDRSLWKSAEEQAGKLALYWRLERVTLPVDLWIETETKTEREAVLAVLQSVVYQLRDGIPADAELALADNANHKYPVRVMTGDPRTQDDRSAPDGFASAVWPLELVTALIQRFEDDTKTQNISVEEF